MAAGKDPPTYIAKLKDVHAKSTLLYESPPSEQTPLLFSVWKDNRIQREGSGRGVGLVQCSKCTHNLKYWEESSY